MKYERTFTENEVKILSHDILDIEDWINKAIEGKINNCLKRAMKEYYEILKAESASTIPLNELEAFSEFTSREDYKNRQKREK